MFELRIFEELVNFKLLFNFLQISNSYVLKLVKCFNV